MREWRALKAIYTVMGDGVSDRFALPANFKRMLLSSQVHPSWAPRTPLQFIPDADEWLMRRMNNETFSWGEWTLIGNDMLIYPILPVGARVSFVYLDKNCVKLSSGGNGPRCL